MDIVLSQAVGTISSASSNKSTTHSTGAPSAPAIILVTSISGDISITLETERNVDPEPDLKPRRRANPNNPQDTSVHTSSQAMPFMANR